MKQKYKSIISMVLILVMVMISTSTSFAQAKKVLALENFDIVGTLQYMGGEISDFKVDGQEKNFKVKYKNGISASVNETVDSNGDIVIYISEDNISNQLVLKDDGSIYLDGELVKEISLEPSKKLNYIQPMVIGNYYNATTPPVGAPSSYTQYVGTENTTLSLGTNYIINMTYTAFSTILGTMSKLAGIAGGILSAIYSTAKTVTPYSNHMSFKTMKYVSTESNNGYFGSAFYIVRNVIKHYGNSDYTGYLGSTTSYGVTQL